MEVWRRWKRRLGLLFRRERLDGELDEEIAFHLEREAEELRSHGIPDGEAERRAREAFGSVRRWRQAARDASGVRPVEELLQDVRFAFRTLGRRPAFTAATLITVAVGVGALTGAFGLLSAVLLDPLPYPGPDRVMAVGTAWEGKPDGGISPAEHFDFERDLRRTFDAYGAFANGGLTLTGDGEPLRVEAAFLTHGALPALGAVPRPGRLFTEEEDLAMAPVALLSHALWRERFGGDSTVVGRSAILDEEAVTIIGVLPRGFRLPGDVVAGTRTDVFMPLGLDPAAADNRGSHFMAGVARLGSGTSPERAAAEVAALGQRWVTAYPDDYPADMGFSTWAVPMSDRVLGDVRPIMLTILGAAALVLLLVAANVAGLHLTAGEGRRRELAVRASLGAGRGRLVRQMLTESALLSVLGGCLGLALAEGAIRLLLAIDPPNLPRIEGAGLTPIVAAVGLGAALLVGVLFGLGPALRLAVAPGAAGLADGLREGARGTTGATGRLRGVLVAGEVAFAVVILTAAALLGRSFRELVSVDAGVRPDSVLTARIGLPGSRYPDPADPGRFSAELERRLNGVPGVRAAGAVGNLPLATGIGDLNFEIEGRPVPEDERSPYADWQVVTPGYLRAMGLTLVRGRWIEAGDDATAPGAVVISEATAARYWPGDDPVGRRFKLGGGAGPGWVTVVGIVRDVRHERLDVPADPQMYLSHAQFRFWGSGNPVRSLTLVLRAEGDPLAFAGPLRRTVRALDSQLPVYRVQTMRQVLDRSVSQPRTLASLLAAFSAIAVLLAAVGVYGIIAHSVAERRRELAIRVALGARAGQVVWPVLRRGGALVGGGLAVGLAAATIVGRGIRGQLYGVSPVEPAALAGVALGIAALGLVATWLPARRAAHVDPAVPLRSE